MSKIDWSKAPEGATHWDGQYYKLGDDFSYFFDSTGWRLSKCERDTVVSMAARPTAWSGEGLPHIGVECEAKIKDLLVNELWIICTISFIGRDVIVYESTTGEYTCNIRDIKFRPIRSEEDKAIDELIKAFYSLHTPTDIATAIYKAGYRLPNA